MESNRLPEEEVNNMLQLFLRNVVKTNLNSLIDEVDNVQNEESLTHEELDKFIEDLEKLIDVFNFIRFNLYCGLKPDYYHPEMEDTYKKMLDKFVSKVISERL